MLCRFVLEVKETNLWQTLNKIKVDIEQTGTALENIIDYAEREFNDDVLNALIEEINGIAGTIQRINNKINLIEQEKEIFGVLSYELEVELKRLKKRLTLEISIL
jgi:hypothetical protein